MTIRTADRKDAWAVTALALRLWPDHDMNDLFDEMVDYMESDGDAVFLALEENGNQAVGFAHASLRYDYVEGTKTSPVGYLEGIFVEDDARRGGVAAALLSACEGWARGKGCREFASDCEARNAVSVQFHQHMGFREANRLVCFVKPLLPPTGKEL